MDFRDIHPDDATGDIPRRGPIERKSRATINDLPPDVLLLIFRKIFLTVRKPRWFDEPIGWTDRGLQPWPSYDSSDPKHPFPESLASVCRYWREVMSTVAFFWTRLVIWVGAEPTPLTIIRDYLTWSRGGLLDIYIAYRSDSPPDADQAECPADLEKAQVKAVMELLIPHVRRWRVLCVDLLHSSSLPLPRIDFVGCADELVRLEQYFIVDDSVANTDAASHVIGEFHTPLLETLRMGGLQFRESYVRPFPRYPMPTLLRDVSIAEYSSHHPSFPMADLLSCLVSCQKMRDIELADLKLECSYTEPPVVSELNDWYPNRIHFVDLPGHIIAECNRLLDYPYIDRVVYTRCTLEIPAPLCPLYYLEFHAIESPASLFCLLAGIPSDTECHEVSFTECDGLTPEVLFALARPWRNTRAWLCPHITDLSIRGCTQLRSSHIRALLEARRDEHAETGHASTYDIHFVVTSITELKVQGCCELDPEDKVWFDANLECVRWDNWKGGTGYKF